MVDDLDVDVDEEELVGKVAALTTRTAQLRAAVSDAFAATLEVREAASVPPGMVELESLRRDLALAEEEMQQEEELESADLLALQSTRDLRSGVECCRFLLDCISQNEQERLKVEEESVRLQFLFEARQIKLLSELHMIYPIERVGSPGEKGTERYAIRGIEFQPPFEGSQRDDEQISTVLGYIVHMTLLASKYLEIPLRYQLLFFASRSMIRDPVQKDPKEQNLPLYRKDVEPERFRRAFHWLTRDVEQLLAARNIAYVRNKDILYNLGLFFKEEIEPSA